MPNRSPSKRTSASSAGNLGLRSSEIAASAIENQSYAQEANIYTIIQLFWRDRLYISLIAVTGFLVALIYALVTPEWYTARIVLAPTNDQYSSSIPGELGGLASLVGLGMASSNSADAKAILTSRSLTSQFISDHDLLQVLFEDQWDSDRQDWVTLDPDDQPDVRDAVDYFEDSIRRIREETSSGHLTMFIEWTDPEMAADWANELANRVNQEMRRRALEEATLNIEFLQGEIAKTNQVAMQQSISRVLESELQRLLIARGNDQFAFKIIDPAEIPKYKSRPKRILIIVSALLFSFLIAFLVVFILEVYRQQQRLTAEGLELTDSSDEKKLL